MICACLFFSWVLDQVYVGMMAFTYARVAAMFEGLPRLRVVK